MTPPAGRRVRPSLPLPSPPLERAGAGVVLRPWGRSDTDASRLAAAWRDDDVVRWTAVPEARGEADAARWIADEAVRRRRGLGLELVIADPADPDAVDGEVGLVLVEPERGWAEVGFWVLPARRRQNRAAAALDLFSGWALASLPVRRLFARVHRANAGAVGVVRSAGYRRAGAVADGTQVWVRDAPGPGHPPGGGGPGPGTVGV